jgi:hypothetical protein
VLLNLPTVEKSIYHSLTGAARRIKQAGIGSVKLAVLSVDRRNSHSARANCGNIFAHQEVIPHVLCSRNSLDGSHGIYRIPSGRPGAANFQQPLNYRSIPRSFNRIFPCYHVHSPREAATKACLSCIFHCTNLPELGHIPRTPRLTSEAKALIQTGGLSPS